MLKAYPFNLAAGDQIVAIFAAHNAVGWGPMSDPTTNGALIQSTPQKMNTPTRDPQTTTQVIQIDWVAQVIPENGYSEVLSYNLQWDRGTGGETWYNLLGYDSDTLVYSYTTINELTAGVFYEFKVRSRNFFGWSEFSDILYVKAATWPTIADPVVTTIDSSTGDIMVSWA